MRSSVLRKNGVYIRRVLSSGTLVSINASELTGWNHRVRDRMVVGFPTTYAFSVCHH